MGRSTIADMNTRPTKNLIIGPVLGWFVSCAVERTEAGFAAHGQLAECESAFGTGSDLPRVVVGPFAEEKLALASLISPVRCRF